MESGKITIICPGCNKEISIDEALKHQLVESEKSKFENEYREKLESEKKRMWAIALEKAAEKAKEESGRWREEGEKRQKELAQVKEELELQKKKRLEAEAVELEIRKEKLRFEEEKKSFELEKQRQLDVERQKIKEETARQIADEHRLKDAEKDKRISDMMRQVEELKRKAEQGSQQMQGEVLELELEEMLGKLFPVDEIVPVPKGINGADIIQNVRDHQGRPAGSIAWELKRTKAWSDGWVQKLKDDQRKVKAEIAVLVSEVLPEEIKKVGLYKGIYVASFEAMAGLAQILRLDIIKITSAKALEEGKSEKKEVIYNYLCSNEFRARVEAIVEATVLAKESLDKEKRAFAKLWSEREKQIDRIETNMIGMYGDMQGIAGRALPQIKSLELEDPSFSVTPDLVPASAGTDPSEEVLEIMPDAIVEDEIEEVNEEKVQQLGF